MKVVRMLLLFRVFIVSTLGMSCARGTEVGNGLKPFDEPNEDKRVGAKEGVGSEDNGTDRITSDKSEMSPVDSTRKKENSPDGQHAPTADSSNDKSIINTKIPIEIMFNTCASPFGDSAMTFKDVEFLGTKIGETTPMRWRLRPLGQGGSFQIEWGLPVTDLFTVAKDPQGQTLYAIKIVENLGIKTPSQCTAPKVQNGEFLGAAIGTVEQFSTWIQFAETQFELIWFVAKVDASRALKAIKVMDAKGQLLYEFKPN